MAAQDVRHFVNRGFDGVNGQRINGNRSMLAVSLTVAVNYLKGSFFDVEGFKRFRSVPSIVCSIRVVFLAVSLCQNEPTRFPDKERVIFRRLFPRGVILDSLLARNRHAKPNRLFSALNEPSLAVPVLQRGDRPYWNFPQRALN